MSRATARPSVQATRGEVGLYSVTFPAGIAQSTALNLEGGSLVPLLIFTSTWPSPTPLIRLVAVTPERRVRTLLVDGAAVDLAVASGSAIVLPASIPAYGAFLVFDLVDSEGAAETFGSDVTVDVLVGAR